MVMLTSYLVWLRSHEPSTYELISVKSLLNHLEYLKFHTLHDNQIGVKQRKYANVLHFLNFFRISKPRSNFGQRKFVQTLWTRQKAFSFNQKVRSEMVMWFGLSPSLVVQEKTIFGSSFTKKNHIFTRNTQKTCYTKHIQVDPM